MPQTNKVSEVRTQIYFPRYLYHRVKQHASARKVSFAAVIREAVEEKVSSPKKQASKNDLMDLAGTIKGEPADMSENISKYIEQMYLEKTP